jgi:phosphoribosyl 1,2-cyclic phosphodiesterase
METIEKTVNFLNMSIKTSMIDNEENEKKDKFKIVFIGTGVSTAVPNLGHVLNDSCVVCRDANTQPGSKNKRNNVSVAIVFTGDDGKEKCVLIDVGKTMREACMSILPKHGIQQVSAIVLTHGHADAILGI